MSAALRERLLLGLEQAGTRGLTREEMRRRFGSTYGLRLRELQADGHVLRFHPSRRRRSRGEWWRVVLVAAAQPAPAAADTAPAELALPLEAPAAPACAIFDLDEGSGRG